MNKPNFLVAGFPKCGTTSIYEYLKIHPEVYLPETKELHYFTQSFLVQSINGPNDDHILSKVLLTSDFQYLNNYQSVKNEIAIGDCSPSYASFPDCIPKIKELLGADVKIIIMLRNPIDRAYSNYRHLVRQGRETSSFLEAIQLEDKRLESGYSDFWGYKCNSLYYERIKKFKNEFANVLIIPFEKLVADKNQFLNLLAFLEVDKSYDTDYLNNRFNEGTNYKQGLLVSALISDNPFKRFIVNNTPKWTHKSLLKMKRSILEKNKTTQTTISIEERRFVKQYFAEDVLKLKEELQIDTSLWSDFDRS